MGSAALETYVPHTTRIQWYRHRKTDVITVDELCGSRMYFMMGLTSRPLPWPPPAPGHKKTQFVSLTSPKVRKINISHRSKKMETIVPWNISNKSQRCWLDTRWWWWSISGIFPQILFLLSLVFTFPDQWPLLDSKTHGPIFFKWQKLRKPNVEFNFRKILTLNNPEGRFKIFIFINPIPAVLWHWAICHLIINHLNSRLDKQWTLFSRPSPGESMILEGS